MGYLQEKEKQEAEAMKLAQDYSGVAGEPDRALPPVVLSRYSGLPERIRRLYCLRRRRKIARWCIGWRQRSFLSACAILRPRLPRSAFFQDLLNF